MNRSTDEPINLRRLAKILRQLRRKHKVSLNSLSKLSGISRRTLARLESRTCTPRSKPRRICRGQDPERSRGTTLSPKTMMKLLRLLLPQETIDEILSDSTKLSRGYAAQLGGSPDDYALLDLLPDPYPYFLFHPPRSEMDRLIRQEFARDYHSSLFQLVLRPPRNLGLRLRAFRLQHDLTLVETATLLGLSKSQLHRLERSERHPSAPTCFRILRLLTAPVSPEAMPQVSRAKSRDNRHAYLEFLRNLLSHPPTSDPSPDSADPLDSLRRLWLSGRYSTRDLAAALGISQPHLIRLLRGDRHPSRALLEKISRLVAALPSALQ